jgi:uncharacterized protein YndB with AHSA1/START domain
MTSSDSPDDLHFTAERTFPVPVERVWAQCTTKRGLESWWSPEDLRTTVKRLEPGVDGPVVLSVRYVPAMLEAGRSEAFRAAGVPISFELRGRIQEWRPNTRLVFALTLTLDRAGAGIETVTELDIDPADTGTHVRLVVGGKTNPHWKTLGRANVEGQLDRLGRSLGTGSRDAASRVDGPPARRTPAPQMPRLT